MDTWSYRSRPLATAGTDQGPHWSLVSSAERRPSPSRQPGSGRSKWRPNCRGAWWRWWLGRPRGPRGPRAPVRPAAASRAHSSSVSLFRWPRSGSVAGVLSLGGSTFPPQPGRTRCEVTPHGSRMFQNTTLFLSCPVVPGKNNVSRSHRWGRSGAVRGPSGAPQNFGICRRHCNGSSFFLLRPAGPGGPSRAPR